MKQNGNDKRTGEYYIGLDIGTDSIGWAVTDKEYRIPKFRGNAMWGIRLFSAGETAAERRTNRTNRRRLARRKWRLSILRDLFDAEITKVDPGFFQRMEDSPLVQGDKTCGTAFSLFADHTFTDKQYHKLYPTIYHLRKELMDNPEPHDIRLVYLALHSLFKARGHFLYDVGDGSGDYNSLMDTLLDLYRERTGYAISVSDKNLLHQVLLNSKMGKSDKYKQIKDWITCSAEEELDPKEAKKVAEAFGKLLCGSKAKLADLFADKDLGTASVAASDSEESLVEACAELGDNSDVIMAAKAVYDSLTLERITGSAASISAYKIAQYNQHKEDIRLLKAYVRNVLKDKELYRKIFNTQKEKLTNYAAYSGYRKGDRECSCSQEDFCKFLAKELEKSTTMVPEYAEMLNRIKDGTFAPKQRGKENGVLPLGLQQQEVEAILKNARGYLPFLSEQDEDGISVSDKLLATFRFRLPYYVGPLSPNAKNRWAVRTNSEPVMPWNFEKAVDTTASAEAFIENLTSQCTYTGENVLPRDSLLYCRYTVLNEINNIQVNGNPLPVAVKQKLYEDLFVKKDRKITKKAILNYLVSEGLCTKEAVISGVDDTLTSRLTSYHKLAGLADGLTEAEKEEIIRRIVLFGDDRTLLKRWLKDNCKLPEEKRSQLAKIRFADWGRLSKYLLTGIYHTDDSTGEASTIMDLLWNTNQNLMQLLSNKYSFLKQAEAHKKELRGAKSTPFSDIQDLYVSPAIRRSIWQTMRIVDELVDIQKCAPAKIFVEVARDQNGKNEKKRTESRKDKLLYLYKQCKQESGELFEKLNAEDEGHLRSDKLYLYYAQLGKCMYTGEPIDIESLGDSGVYDIDHIYPRSRIKDDSMDNRVLVKAVQNRAKTNIYPISQDIRDKMTPFWHLLRSSNLISEEKMKRLTRSTPLTDEELSAFVARQLVETRQSTKAVAELLQNYYPNSKVVCSKAGNVTEFRQQYHLVKCREINDLHHAKDAYLNVVVGNFYDTRFTDNFFKHIDTEIYSLRPDTMYGFAVKGAWVPGDDGTIATVKQMMAKNNIRYTRPARQVGGALFDLQLMKAGKGQIPVKSGRSIDAYGGYNKPTGTYFALVEHMEKGKAVRTLEAVYLADKAKYEANPDEYASQKWYQDSKIIVKTILIGALLEIDGARMSISSRTGGNIIYTHAYQLAMGEELEKYLKCIIKVNQRSKTAKDEYTVTTFDGVSVERNIEVYQWFVDKLEISVYGLLFPAMLNHLKNSKGVFEKMNCLEQCDLLAEILKAFQCNAVYPSFEKLCNVKLVGRISKSKKISQAKKARLIHQSITGLYETAVDLLG